MSGIKNAYFSTFCVCGRVKRSESPLCYQCYMLLPVSMQRGLRKELGKGYEEAYSIAVIKLKKMKGKK